MDGLYRARRGVCIGPERILLPTDPPVRLDRGTAQFLLSIGAIEEAPQPAPEPEVAAAAPPPAAEPEPAAAQQPPASETTAPVKSGKKEK